VLGQTNLVGAGLDSAGFQGAWFEDTQLQGTLLDRVELQGATLDHVFVWRADVRHTHSEGARLVSPETGSKYRASQCSEPCDWSAKSFTALKQFIERQVPEGGRREAALRRIAALDPAKPLPEEKALANAWADLAQSSPSLDDYEKDLVKWLRATSCDPRGAPFEIRQLLPHLPFRFRPGSSQPAALATAFLDEVHCPGARGLSDEEKFRLEMLRDKASPAPN
jgi:uncharacterized protein YjbI with pentapeptide repeats